MAHLRNFRCSGTIARSSGAAVAALKARAAAWEVPLIETPDRLSLMVWGSELRLSLQPDALSIDLFAPERRLLGNLRDSATELFAEIGLAVQWDHVDDIGGLAPGLALMRVTAITPVSPNFIRVRLTGAEAARFASGGLHFRLLLPPAGRIPVWPRVAETGRTVWPVGQDALHRPVYTVVAQAEDWLDFDIFRHSDSPTCDWIATGPLGQTVGVLGPGGGWCPDTEQLLLFGDETALPAIVRMLSLARGKVQATLRCDPQDLGGLADDPRISLCKDLLDALNRQKDMAKNSYVWFAGDADAARDTRSILIGLGIPKQRFTAAAYWSR